MRFTPEDFSLIVGLVSAMLAIYGRFKTEILMQEKRMTVLEKDNEFLKELGLPLLPYGTSMTLPK